MKLNSKTKKEPQDIISQNHRTSHCKYLCCKITTTWSRMTQKLFVTYKEMSYHSSFNKSYPLLFSPV